MFHPCKCDVTFFRPYKSVSRHELCLQCKYKCCPAHAEVARPHNFCGAVLPVETGQHFTMATFWESTKRWLQQPLGNHVAHSMKDLFQDIIRAFGPSHIIRHSLLLKQTLDAVSKPFFCLEIGCKISKCLEENWTLHANIYTCKYIYLHD